MRSPVALATIWLALACGAPDATAPHGPAPAFNLNLDRQDAAPGDSVKFSITFALGDVPGDPLYLRMAFDAQAAVSDTLAVPAQRRALTGVLEVPPKLSAGTLRVTVVVPSRGDSSSASVKITPRPPTRSLSIVLVSPATPAAFTTSPFNRVIDFISGKTDTVVITAVDSSGLAWIGWALGPPANRRDSAQVNGTSAVKSFALAAPGGPDTSPAALEIFARARDGTLTDTMFTIGGIADFLDRPVASAPLAATVHDMVYDPKRHVVYLSEQGQSSIVVLSVPTMTYAAPIPLPGQPAGIDLVPTSDSLVVALANTDGLAFVDLTSAAHPTSELTLGSFAPYTILYPRVAQDRRVLLVLGGEGGGVGDYDLVTGSADFYFSGADGSVPVRSGNGAIVVLRDVARCGLGEYDATAHEFSVYLSTCGEQYPGQVSASHTGTRLNIGVGLYNAGLASLGSAQIPDLPITLGVTYGAAVSDGGGDFFVVAPAVCGVGACVQTDPAYYFRFALSSDATPSMTLREIVNTPETPLELLPIPGDQALLAVGPTKLMLFDLTQASPAASRHSLRYAATGHGAPPRGQARRSR